MVSLFTRFKKWSKNNKLLIFILIVSIIGIFVFGAIFLIVILVVLAGKATSTIVGKKEEPLDEYQKRFIEILSKTEDLFYKHKKYIDASNIHQEWVEEHVKLLDDIYDKNKMVLAYAKHLYFSVIIKDELTGSMSEDIKDIYNTLRDKFIEDEITGYTYGYELIMDNEDIFSVFLLIILRVTRSIDIFNKIVENEKLRDALMGEDVFVPETVNKIFTKVIKMNDEVLNLLEKEMNDNFRKGFRKGFK